MNSTQKKEVDMSPELLKKKEELLAANKAAATSILLGLKLSLSRTCTSVEIKSS